MRALRVVGLGIDGRTVILEAVEQRSGERRERFTLPADEGLHAAVRGDLPRLGQIEIELESQMRPREIQARIRAGESVEQVATAAGVPIQRIERFAYPVLLERSRTAQLAQQAHPVRSDGPDVRTLDEVVSETFSKRGHDYDAVTWDSWRGEAGKWIVQLRWPAGRSDNSAHWTFQPGAHGGTVTAIDDHAADLIDPQPATQLRPVTPVTPLSHVNRPNPGWESAQPEPPAAGSHTESPVVELPPDVRAVPDDGPAYRPSRAEPSRPAHSEPPRPEPARPPYSEPARPEPARPEPARSEPARPEPSSPAPPHQPEPSQPEPPQSEPSQPEPSQSEPPQPDTAPDQPEQQRPAAQAPKRGRKDRPIVPSWEDVLLGVRSPRE